MKANATTPDLINPITNLTDMQDHAGRLSVRLDLLGFLIAASGDAEWTGERLDAFGTLLDEARERVDEINEAAGNIDKAADRRHGGGPHVPVAD